MIASVRRPKILGTGLIALDMVISAHPSTPVRCWTGGTCGNVLSILAWLGWDAYPVSRMNGDSASECIRADMEGWGVHLDWANCAPTTNTPMVVEQIFHERDGQPGHRFLWSCPHCGGRLPGFKPISVAAAERIMPEVADASVFFFDRPSRATLALAAEASEQGAVVVFEPSGTGSGSLVAEGISVAHVVKYAEGRWEKSYDSIEINSAALVEVRTLGERGLEYRHRLGRSVSDWTLQKAFSVPRPADACGAGDWCTAGLIAKTSGGGLKTLRRAGARGVRDALRYGQALAAWNCRFEGARGGMYVVDREIFEKEIASVVDNGELERIDADPEVSTSCQSVTCPSCSRGSI